MPHFIHLKLRKSMRLGLFFLWCLACRHAFLLLGCLLWRLRDVLAVLKGLLAHVLFSFCLFILLFLVVRLALFELFAVSSLDLLSKFLRQTSRTCILSSFFFFSCHYSPPMFAPNPPSLTHSLLVFFLASHDSPREDTVLTVCFMSAIGLRLSSFSVYFGCAWGAFLEANLSSTAGSSSSIRNGFAMKNGLGSEGCAEHCSVGLVTSASFLPLLGGGYGFRLSSSLDWMSCGCALTSLEL